MSDIPVIAIDGPSSSGKGTVGRLVAERLGWHFLDSGALYRVLGLAALRQQFDLEDEYKLAQLAGTLKVKCDEKIWLNNQDVSAEIRSEQCGKAASQLAKWPKVRTALLDFQRAFRKPPGLVADGRDMGTVVFTDAVLKIFLEASAEARAERRYKQLKEQGINVNLGAILQDLQLRDEVDRGRAVAPLKPAVDATIIDTTALSVADVISKILGYARELNLLK